MWSLAQATYNKGRTLFLVSAWKEHKCVQDLDASVIVNEDAFGIFFAGYGCQHRNMSDMMLGTYTVVSAAWMAALRTLTATTGLRALTAASNGSRWGFS